MYFYEQLIKNEGFLLATPSDSKVIITIKFMMKLHLLDISKGYYLRLPLKLLLHPLSVLHIYKVAKV